MKLTHVSTLGFLVGLGLLAAGCSQDSTASSRPRGSYTAARRYRVGSNIPQAQSASGVNDTINTDDLDRMGNNMNRSTMQSMSGGGAGGR